MGRIRRTRLIFRYDSYNRTNFHRYIDDYPHVVVVIKTDYSYMVAAYAEHGFVAGEAGIGRGLLMALGTGQVWSVQQGKRPTTYDDYYIIFGNSDLRLRALEKKVFSNFGLSNSCYEKGSVEELLGESEREVDITGYEVYALELKE